MTSTSVATEAGRRPRVLPDPRLVEFMVCTTALAGGRLNGRLAVPVALLAGVVAAHGLVLVRWPARRGLRLACFAVMLVLLGVVPAARYMEATERGDVRLAHDGGVLVSDEAVEVLLEGRDPYQASYAEVLARWRIDVEGTPAANPLIDHYHYWPGSLGLLAAVEAPLRAVGRDADPRVLYLLVYCALGLWLGRWSLRQRGHLGVALAVCLNPLLLPYLWQGVNDILLVAGMAVAAVALASRRVVLAGLALGATLTVKALLAPMVVLFLVWLAAETRRGRLDRGRAWRAAAATVAPAAATAVPFLLWHPVDFLTDAVAYPLGLVADAYPVSGNGLAAQLLRAGVVTDPFGPSPLWATTLPAALVLVAGAWWVWSRPGLRTLLGVSSLVLLGVLFFHRSFMFYYVAAPATAFALAALVPVRTPGAASGRPPEPATTA
jgi:Glycosyltransferase family 87